MGKLDSMEVMFILRFVTQPLRRSQRWEAEHSIALLKLLGLYPQLNS